MNDKTIDYYFWLNSDWAYLGADRLQGIADKYDVAINYKPVDLPDVYARTGGMLLHQRSPERQAYRVAELKRWCRKLGIHINPHPRYLCPNADLASCMVIAASQSGADITALYKAILRAEWCEDQDISSDITLIDIANKQRLDGQALVNQARTPQILSLYRQYTDEAVGCGIFGSPSYVFQDELFWGQDRLDMLEEAIQRAG
ncbi:2-hydroxychromene-2-carboxylate [Advenella kashmirensis WT001]|uniref:2-hydroxychromene-2-carboxylate isomerase n=1 Tax=Advenella kashmirensis (strain DSM 17095 / LMG 22695 / WT001) TaxID=1036672 RepID=I3UG30_ADVKW|nr:2-hydroxychromene-2-carboxylate isomerase [Advenella kashmirensis]AFK63968.1 2-hydroxychromene-2-carboxylate [Advenella kashmirensis WT001]